MPRFERHIGIDYSGAATPETPLPGIRVAEARGRRCGPVETSGHWSRRTAAEWILETLREKSPAIVGIDHAFSFPAAWFEATGVEKSWPAFLTDFSKRWPTDRHASRVEDFRKLPANRTGSARWRRLAELRCGAKSVFHFDVPGSVAKSTHAGIPWLTFLRRELGDRIHFWPFDGFDIPPGRHAIAEVYPSLWRKSPPPPGTSPDAFDALTITSQLHRADQSGDLEKMLHPDFSAEEKQTALFEGWILGVR
jgi:hypothetical protein